MREPALAFVAGFLQHDERAIQEAAAVALGESHQVQAFPFLEAAGRPGRWRDAQDTAGSALPYSARNALDFLISLMLEGREPGGPRPCRL